MTNTLGIFGGRASGKSTQVIKVAVENGYDIVVHSENGKKCMENSLQRYEEKDNRVKEVKVYTIREITDKHKRDGSVRKPFVVDELKACLSNVFEDFGDMVGFSENGTVTDLNKGKRIVVPYYVAEDIRNLKMGKSPHMRLPIEGSYATKLWLHRTIANSTMLSKGFDIVETMKAPLKFAEGVIYQLTYSEKDWQGEWVSKVLLVRNPTIHYSEQFMEYTIEGNFLKLLENCEEVVHRVIFHESVVSNNKISIELPSENWKNVYDSYFPDVVFQVGDIVKYKENGRAELVTEMNRSIFQVDYDTTGIGTRPYVYMKNIGTALSPKYKK